MMSHQETRRNADPVDPDRTYGTMVRMRAFEIALRDGVENGEIHGEMHIGIGQEAIAAGIEPSLTASDAVVSTHRPHLHALAHGVEPVGLLAELFERAEGLNGGKGGHMHLFASDRQFMCTGIVGASAPIALGYAFAFKRNQAPNIAVAILGDGAMNQGTTAEALNLAALWELPILFLVEDNGFGISVRREDSSAGELVHRGEPYGIPGFACDGTDVEAVQELASRTVRDVRSDRGPALLVAHAHRHSGHYEGDPDHYRSKDEKAEGLADERDPIARYRATLIGRGWSPDELAALERREQDRVSEWVESAKAKPWPSTAAAFEGVFA